MKTTMDKRNVAKFHKLLAEKISVAKCSKLLKIAVKTLNKFTPEKVAVFKKKQAEIAEEQKKKLEQLKNTGAALAEAAKQVADEVKED